VNVRAGSRDFRVSSSVANDRLEHLASADPPSDGSCLEVLVPCQDCMGRGTDASKDALYLPGTTAVRDILCESCRGTGRTVRYLDEDALVDYVIARMSERIPDILKRMKEEAVRDVMES
jgi:hypothetical protein